MEPDDLYGLPLDRFIPERAALARDLRSRKERDDAADVAALRKPSVAAWAVNQLMRSQGSAAADLFAAGDALRGAQADLLAGRGDGRALRAAGERERAAVDTLVDAARGLLTTEGHELSPAVVERVADTLHAAALDEDAREQVRAGRLERELRHVGLGLGEAAPAAPAPSRPPAPKQRETRGAGQADTKESRAEGAREARMAREQATAAQRDRDAVRKAARTAEAQARRRAERSGHALRAAEERRARAAQALDEADEALAAARVEAQEAGDAHRRARDELDAL